MKFSIEERISGKVNVLKGIEGIQVSPWNRTCLGTPATAAPSSGERLTEGMPIVDLHGLNAAVPAGSNGRGSFFGAVRSGYQRQGSRPPDPRDRAPIAPRLGRQRLPEARKAEYDQLVESKARKANLRLVQKSRCTAKEKILEEAMTALKTAPILNKVMASAAKETADAQMKVSKEIQEQQMKALTSLQVPPLDCEVFKGMDNEKWAAWVFNLRTNLSKGH